MRAQVVARLPRDRCRHVEGVVQTAGRIAGRWEPADRDAALRAAWLHDAWRTESTDAMRTAIRAAGETPDPWAVRNAPVLLHAQAAAVWGRDALGEGDPRVLLAVRHHPTAHPDWEDVGRALYVADFCEPGRAFAAEIGAADLVAEAAAGAAGLATVAARVLALRLARSIDGGRPVHPHTWRAWNAWNGAAEPG